MNKISKHFTFTLHLVSVIFILLLCCNITSASNLSSCLIDQIDSSIEIFKGARFKLSEIKTFLDISNEPFLKIVKLHHNKAEILEVGTGRTLKAGCPLDVRLQRTLDDLKRASNKIKLQKLYFYCWIYRMEGKIHFIRINLFLFGHMLLMKKLGRLYCSLITKRIIMNCLKKFMRLAPQVQMRGIKK